MKSLLSVLMVTKNSGELLNNSLNSVRNLAKNIVIIDDFSTDKTVFIAKQHGASLYRRRDKDLGRQRSFGLSKCKCEWVLMLDADEVVSKELASEIALSINVSSSDISGYYIPYQNHLFGKPIYHGGESYRILRLFKRSKATIKGNLVHEHVRVVGRVGELHHKIFHYSYRTPYQVIRKFTDYAVRASSQKADQNERLSAKKLFIYPLHMIWARYIKDGGYKDGLTRIFLDFAFGYMEFCTYFLLLFKKRK